MNNKEITERLELVLGCMIGSHTSCQTPKKQLEYLIEELKAKNNEVLDLVMLSLSFAEWIDINCIRSGAYEWTYRGDNFTKTYSTEEMLNEHKRIINSEA